MDARKVDALQVAQEAGLQLKRNGSRYWACCPIHGEKTPSLCFYPDGKWHCFGCSAHGDAADLYAALYGVSLKEALRAVNGGLRTEKRMRTPGEELKAQVDKWKKDAWADACRSFHFSNAVIEAATPRDAAFWMAVETRAEAQDFLNFLETATPSQLVKAFMEDRQDAERTRRRNAAI